MNSSQSSDIRTFRGPDSRSVLAAVKAALGSEAMILSSREIPSTFFKPAVVEVTAALMPEAANEPEVPAINPQAEAANSAARERLEMDRDLGRELETLRASLSETQSALATVNRQVRAGQDLQLAPAAAEFHTYLCMQGVDPSLAEELVRQLVLGGVPRTSAGFREPARRALARLVKSAPPPYQPLRDRKRRVIALVGPTGVGKTTTLAKIAAKALLDHKQKVALITLDTYRIGAAEQIAHYGNLMDAPTFVARDRAELCSALARSGEASLVLIDTAGRSRMDDVLKQADLLRAIPAVELQLVLSALTSATDLEQIARRYRALLPSQIIFTKVDETSTPGAVLSALAVAQRPVSCITNGQRVPEDIQAQSDDDLIDLVLGESEWSQGRNS